MRAGSRNARVGRLLVALSLAGCHRGGATQAPVAVESGEIGNGGDSSTVGIRIVGFNASRDRATFMLPVPAHVVALAVVPGKTVEPVGSSSGADTTMTAAGAHELAIALPRPAGAAPSSPRLVDQVDYQRCVNQQVRAGTRRRTVKKVARDSTGRPVEVETTEVDAELDLERRAERACAGVLKRQGPEAPPERERFLLLIASDVRIPPAKLRERLDAMTVTASDVPTTISAIADALYFDRRAIWSGHYMRW